MIDTDVVLSGLRSASGASRLLLIAVAEGIVTPVASVAMMIEYEAVLTRSEHLAQIGISSIDMDVFLDSLAARLVPVAEGFSHRPAIRDPDDEMFVEAAVNGGAAYPVTFNVADYRRPVRQGLDLGIAVLRPGEFLGRLDWRPSATSLSGFRLP